MTLSYDWLVPIQKQLQHQLNDQQLPHAVLIVGHEMQGALALQEWLVAALLCTESAHDPCGHCHSCRLLRAGHHPDLMWLQPEGKAQLIKVDAVRELNQFCQGTAQQGAAQVAAVVSADRFNLASGNAILKTLEEPPAQTFLILQSAQPGALLPTIRSRLQRVVCPKPTTAQSLAWLINQGVSPEAAQHYLDLSLGAPLQALQWAQGESLPSHVEWQTWLLHHLQKPRLSLSAVQGLSAETIPSVIETWLDAISAMVRYAHTQEHNALARLQDPSQWAALVEGASSFALWQALYDDARQTQQQLQRANHLNANLLLEQLWLKLAKQRMKA